MTGLIFFYKLIEHSILSGLQGARRMVRVEVPVDRSVFVRGGVGGELGLRCCLIVLNPYLMLRRDIH